MRSNQASGRRPADHTDGSGEAPREIDPWADAIERIAADLKACEALGDDELARRAGRKLLAAVGVAADALLCDGGKGLQTAPDKIGAFFDKSAAGFVQAVEGMHRRAVLAQAGDAFEPRLCPDHLAPAMAAWRAAAPSAQRE